MLLLKDDNNNNIFPYSILYACSMCISIFFLCFCLSFTSSLSFLQVIELCRPSDSRLEHVDFECLFSSLSLRLLLRVFASLLLERRVIFTADKLRLALTTYYYRALQSHSLLSKCSIPATSISPGWCSWCHYGILINLI